jgi:hypothetical protein
MPLAGGRFNPACARKRAKAVRGMTAAPLLIASVALRTRQDRKHRHGRPDQPLGANESLVIVGLSACAENANAAPAVASFVSSKTRDAVTTEFLSGREQVAQMTGEDSGSRLLSQAQRAAGKESILAQRQ